MLDCRWLSDPGGQIETRAGRGADNIDQQLLGCRQLLLEGLDPVVVHLGQLRRCRYRIVELAEFINESVLERIEPRPDLALSNAVDLALIHSATSGDIADEIVIRILDRHLDQRLGIVGHRPVRPQFAGPRRCADAVGRDPDRGNRSLERRDHCEYADGPGDCCRTGEQLVGIHRNCVAAGRRHAAHRCDDRLAILSQGLDLVGDDLGSECAAARAVHPQHDSFDRLVIARLAQQRRSRVAADRSWGLVAKKDISRRDDNRHILLLDGAQGIRTYQQR